jgi:trk system potassium uptake protein TrkH
MKVVHTIIEKISLFSPAQLTVLSFCILSVLGGMSLWFTEKDRIVTANNVVHKQVRVVTQETTSPARILETRNEVHTFVEKKNQQGETFIDTIFIAVSALCLTGLTPTNFSDFTLAGQLITLGLIQIGGIGIIVFTSIFAMTISRGISEHATLKKILSNLLDITESQVKEIIRRVVLYALFFEGSATLILGIYLQFISPSHGYGHINPWWWAVFHSVSAFNNSGFTLLPNSLINFAADPVINFVISTLMIFGMIGYPVLIVLHTFIRKQFIKNDDKEQKKLREDIKALSTSPLQIHLTLIGTAFLIILGTIVLFFENSHNAAFSHYSTFQQILIFYFQSIASLTSGFNTINIGSLGIATILFFIGFMYIGTNPAGTGGGIKIPTMVVLYGYIKDWFLKPGLPVMLLGRTVSRFAVSHAIRLFFISILLISFVTLVICMIEGQWLITPDPVFNFLKVLFEVVSAFGTVGLSMGYDHGTTSFSGLLSPASKSLIILTMLIGRLGPLTLLAALPWKHELKDEELTPDYPHAEKIQIG